ncbi:MAG: hypothetical protein JJW00_05435, partial [Sulfurimonas sp.]|nr:hypothetical protein [Sulfurimonas sp.]
MIKKLTNIEFKESPRDTEKSKENLFDIWSGKKQNIHKKEQFVQFKERDILFLSVGQNVGYEQYGKGEEF